MKTLVIYESYWSKWYGHKPLGKVRVTNAVFPLDLWRQLVLVEGYTKNLYVVDDLDLIFDDQISA